MGNLTHTVSGDIASFRSAARVPIENLKCYFKPKQDLHGYSKPWPGGGEKNLLDVAGSTPQYTSYVLSEGAISINAVGGGNGSFQWFDQSFPAGTYTMSAKYSGSVSGVRFLCTEALTNWTWNDYYNGYFSSINNTITFTATETFSVGVVFLTLADHIGESGTIYDIQLEQASAATTYSPYENICSIEGWNQIIINKSGKNLGTVESLLGGRPYTEVVEDGRTCVYVKASGNNTIENSINPVSFVGAFKSNTQYTISFYAKGIKNPEVGSDPVSPFRIFIDYTDDTSDLLDIYLQHCSSWTLLSKTSKSGKTIKQLRLGNYEYRLMVYIDKNTFQIEEGTQITTFEPYQGDIIPITFPANSKNLYDINTYPLSQGYVLWSGDGSVSNGYNSYATTLGYVPCENMAGKKVTLNKRCGGVWIGFAFYSSNNANSYLSGIRDGGGGSAGTPWTLTIPENAKYMRFTVPADTYDIQIELGDTATSYEPYSSDNTFYGGYIDPVVGEIVVEYKKHIYDGTTLKIGMNYKTSDRFFGLKSASDCQPGSDGHVISNMLKTQSSHGKNVCYQRPTDPGYLLDFGRTTICDLSLEEYDALSIQEQIDLMNNYLANLYVNGTPLTVVYKLISPIHIPISTQNLKTFLDRNNFWSNANDIVEITYQVHDSNMIQQAKKNIMSENATHYKKVIWNNIVNGDVNSTDWRAYSSSAISVTFNSGIANCEVIDTTKVRYTAGIVTSNYPSVLQSNKYYASYEVKPEYFGKFGIEFASGQQLDGSSIPCLPNVWRRRSFLKNGRNDASGAMYIPFPAGYPSNITPRFQVKLPLYVDLTKMFGSGNEPQTAREFEALCKFNNVSLEEIHNKDVVGTEKVWIIPKRKRVIWNQIAAYPTLNDYKPYDETNTLTEENGELIITYGVKSNDYHNCISTKKTTNYYQNHKYYVKQDFCPSWNSTRIGVSICNYASVLYPQATANEYISVSYILEKLTANNDHNILLAYPYNENNLSIGDSCRVKNIILVDLTLMFGAGSEPKTAQEFEAMCEKNCIDLSQFWAQDKGTEELWII